MSEAKTNTERKALERARKRAQGYVLLQVWIKPDWKNKIKALINKLDK